MSGTRRPNMASLQPASGGESIGSPADKTGIPLEKKEKPEIKKGGSNKKDNTVSS
jgi:hypothetical protein